MMKEFIITPVTERIFIFSGESATGKSHFARNINNAIIIDDCYFGSEKLDKTIRDTLISVFYPEYYNMNISRTKLNITPSTIIVFITNDDRVKNYIYKRIIEEIEYIKKYIEAMNNVVIT